MSACKASCQLFLTEVGNISQLIRLRPRSAPFFRQLVFFSFFTFYPLESVQNLPFDLAMSTFSKGPDTYF